MYLNLPDTYADAFQTLSELQFTSETELEMFFRMMESFSGQPLRLTNAANLEQTCRFDLTASTRRRLQETPSPRVSESCVSNASSVLIYFSGVGYSPSSAIQNVYKMQ